MKKVAILITAILIFGSIQFTKAQDAATIVQKVDNTISGWKDVSQTVEITLIDKNGNKEVRTASVIQKGNDKRLLKFTSPAAQKGIAFLSLPDDVMYLYMPAFGKERRIASSVKNQKFAGTDLTYDDLQAKKYADKYSSKILKSDVNSYQLEMTPKTSCDYAKVIFTVSAKNFTPLSADFYDKSNTLVKSTTFVFAQSGKYWYAQSLTVVDKKTNHTTIMKTSNVKFDQNLNDDLFSIRNLTSN